MKKDILKIIRENGGQIRMSHAIAMGISRYRLYSLKDKGLLECVSRGIYRLVDMPAMTNPDLVIVFSRFPHAVICLISALAFHDLTTQIPHEVFIAVNRDSRPPSLDYPPLSVHRFSDDAFNTGIEIQQIDGVHVRIYNPEKTLADCFKFRNKLGMDIVLEALKLYREKRPFKVDKIMKYARICRVARIMKPYLEASL